MNFSKIFFVICCLCLLSFTYNIKANSNDLSDLAPKKFLELTRQNHPTRTWAILKGKLVNKRKNAELKRAEIRVGMRFAKERVIAQITLKKLKNHGKKITTYKVGQTYDGSRPSIILPEKNKKLSLEDYGVKPQDLTMAFLYWNYKKEISNAEVNMLSCRVFILSSPETEKKVKIFISQKYAYPLKVKWFKKDNNKSYRSMLIKSFEKQNELVSPSEIELFGPGWRTKIEFTKISLGYTKNGVPKDIFN